MHCFPYPLHLFPLLLFVLLAGCSEQSERTQAARGDVSVLSPSAEPSAASAWRSVALTYVGSEACQGCHEEAFAAWQGSHHERALLPVDAAQADFSGQELATGDEIVRFARTADELQIDVEAGEDSVAGLPVSHVIGVEPLQQYVVAQPNGWYQMVPVAWDTSAAQRGWFHLYPDDPPPPGDPLHWDGHLQNFNSQCAECHVTDYAKNFRASDRSYESRWSEPRVGCEGCHGRGARHIAWAQAAGDAAVEGRGLELSLGEEGAWVMSSESGIAQREPALEEHAQVEACGRCHARRTRLSDNYRFGKPLADTHLPALLRPGLYHADGQILDEVYVYGSFVQSKMHAAGVQCTDCHDPHTARLKSDPNGVCAQCHAPSVFAVAEHHRHENDSPGCVDCHMAKRYYMVIDGRRDHSFRVPRPDLSVRLGTPNACNDCHDDKEAGWAADAVAQWYPEGRHTRRHYGEALATAWHGAPRDAVALAGERSQPAFVRASALAALEGQVQPWMLDTIDAALADSELLVRLGALQALGGLPAEVTVTRVLPLIKDPIKSVRLEAARLVAASDGQLDPGWQEALEQVLAETQAADRFHYDRPFGYLNAANLASSRGAATQAARLLEQGIEVFPQELALQVNLADAYRATGREAEALDVLLDAKQRNAESAQVLQALALAQVRAGDYAAAVTELEAWHELEPGSAQAGGLLVLALERVGDIERAGKLLRELRAAHPDDAFVQSIRLGS